MISLAGHEPQQPPLAKAPSRSPDLQSVIQGLYRDDGKWKLLFSVVGLYRVYIGIVEKNGDYY